MTTSSEDVLQSVAQVRHKKTDGTLYVMPERIGWMPNGKDTITISIKYSDIKLQKISPEGKPKVQLQLVLNSSNEAPTFHFVNPAGAAAQLKDRNDVKELLQSLLPKFKNRLTKDIEFKNSVLNKYPDLYQMYKDLVTSNVISADKFWQEIVPSRLTGGNSAPRMSNGAGGTANTNGIGRSVNGANTSSSLLLGQVQQQAVGISPAFLSGIKPTADGTNGIKYNINTDIIEAIFRTYPAVKRKHFENVPQKMSESDFWTKFFQSHYFHRDRVFASGSNKGDFFAECARSDELNMKQAASQGINDDPFVDLTAFDDAEYVHMPDYGNKDNEASIATTSNGISGTSKAVKEKSRDRDRFVDNISSITNPNQALIKRFNHHSIMVLDACLTSKDSGGGSTLGSESPSSGSIKSSSTIATPGSANGSLRTHSRQTNGLKKAASSPSPSPSPSCSSHYSAESTAEEDDARRKKQRLEEKTALDDLSSSASVSTDPNSWVAQGARPLKIRDRELYMVGPCSTTTLAHCDTSNGTSSSLSSSLHYSHHSNQRPSSLIESAASQQKRLSDWRPVLSGALSSPSALTALSDLSPGGALLKSSHTAELKDSISLDVQKELRNVYMACNELLRQFWSNFPVTNEKQEEKLVLMKATLEKFQYSKLQPLQNKIAKEHYNSDLTTHLGHQLQKAFSRFQTWQTKKGLLASRK